MIGRLLRKWAWTLVRDEVAARDLRVIALAQTMSNAALDVATRQDMIVMGQFIDLANGLGVPMKDAPPLKDSVH